MTVKDIVKQREIVEILHFTTNQGLLGILATKALLSRKRLPEEKYLEHVYKPNCAKRKDHEWFDYVNLSISRINSSLFDISSENWHKDADVWWCVLSFDPVILSHSGVYFTTTNNMYTGVSRKVGPQGLEALFAPAVKRWEGNTISRDPNMPMSYPTCLYAEVLYPEQVSTKYLKHVYVLNPAYQDDICGQCAALSLPAIEVHVKPAAFGKIYRGE